MALRVMENLVKYAVLFNKFANIPISMALEIMGLDQGTILEESFDLDRLRARYDELKEDLEEDDLGRLNNAYDAIEAWWAELVGQKDFFTDWRSGPVYTEKEKERETESERASRLARETREEEEEAIRDRRRQLADEILARENARRAERRVEKEKSFEEQLVRDEELMDSLFEQALEKHLRGKGEGGVSEALRLLPMGIEQKQEELDEVLRDVISGMYHHERSEAIYDSSSPEMVPTPVLNPLDRKRFNKILKKRPGFINESLMNILRRLDPGAIDELSRKHPGAPWGGPELRRYVSLARLMELGAYEMGSVPEMVMELRRRTRDAGPRFLKYDYGRMAKPILDYLEKTPRNDVGFVLHPQEAVHAITEEADRIGGYVQALDTLDDMEEENRWRVAYRLHELLKLAMK